MTVSKRLRYEVLRRDNHACRYCGGVAPDVVLTVDHVVPVALGGSDDPSNLVAACKDCNSGKSATPVGADLVADVQQDAMRWAAAMRRAADNAQIERDEQLEIERAVLSYWEGADYYGRKYSEWLPDDWYLSVQRWVKSGLTKADLEDACHGTIYGRRKKPTYDEAWKYFCGTCWGMLKDRQQAAQQLLATEGATGSLQGVDEIDHCGRDEQCQVHNSGNYECPECGRTDCDFLCGLGKGVRLGRADALRANATAINGYRHLSAVCDGRALAEMGLTA